MLDLAKRYSREELLKIRTNTLSLSKPQDWHIIDGLLPSNNRETQARLYTPGTKTAKYKQKAIPTLIRPRLHNHTKNWRNRGYSRDNLITIPTYSSITALTSNTHRAKNLHSKCTTGQHKQGSRAAHNAGLVDPGPIHPFRFLDTEAHNASVRTTAFGQEEDVEVRAHKTGAASGARASPGKLAAPAAGYKATGRSTRSSSANNLIQVPTLNSKQQRGDKNPSMTPTILYTNCRSLNRWKLEELANMTELHQPGIICLTETWLKDTKSDDLKAFNGFTAHITNRVDRIGGGVAILTADSLSAKCVESYTSTTLSAIWIYANINRHPLIIGCIYHPPNSDADTTINYFNTTILKLSKKHSAAKYIVTGDFNKLAIEDHCEQLGLHNIIEFNTRGQSILDPVYTDILSKEDATKLSPLANNDHCCILIKGKPLKANRYTTIEKRLMNSTAKERILTDLTKLEWNEVYAAKTVHEKASQLHTSVNAILNKHCPLSTCKQRVDKPPWITASIIKQIRARDKAFSKNCPSWKVLRRLIQRQIRRNKRLYVENELNSNKPTSKEWWQTLKKLTHLAMPIPSDHTTIGEERLTQEQMANNLNEFFTTVGGPQIIRASNTTPTHEQSGLQHVSIGEIERMLQKIDTTKVCNTEDFPAWISKYGSEDICIPMHHIVNCMLDTQQFPGIWKRSMIRPLKKVDSPSAYKDFRPIALLFHLGKIAEQTIINKMSHRVANSIKDNQYAYRPKVSTTDALLQLTDDWAFALDSARCDYVHNAMIDFSKAFDRLQADIVIEKMVKLDFHPHLTLLIKNFLSDRYQCVRYGNCKSEYSPINVGAPQGTKLGPVLWIIYINDLEIAEYSSVKYADDLTFYQAVIKGHSPTQNPLLEAEEWAQRNNMLINQSKTVVLNVSHHHQVTSSNDGIIPSESTKLLGVIVDHRLTFKAHADYLIKRSNRTLYLMHKLKSYGVKPKFLLTFYLTNIRPIVTYAAPAWYTLLDKQTQNKLESIQRRASKMITSDHDATYEERLQKIELCTLNDFMKEKCLQHFNKIAYDPNHPHHSRVVFNTARRSARNPTTFRPARCRTEKYKKSFFNHMMSLLNENR